VKNALKKAKEILFKSKAKRKRETAKLFDAGQDDRRVAFRGLMSAAVEGDIRKAKHWISRGADVNERDFGTIHTTALMEAAANGYLDVCRVLLEHGADPNMKEDTFGIDALTFAAKRCHVGICILLIRKGAKPMVSDENWNEVPPVISHHNEKNPLSQEQLDSIVTMSKIMGESSFDMFLEAFSQCVKSG
jgi:ankyrin repeat protein